MEQKKKTEQIHKNHRTRMKQTYLEHGLDAFSDIEKLEFILYFAIAQKDTNPIAHRLLKEYGSLDRVLEAPIETLSKMEGLGEHSAILLNLMLQVASAYGKNKNEKVIDGIESAKAYAANLFKGKYVEEFYVICLSASNKVICAKCINKGTSNEVPVNIRSITDLAFKHNCERIILTHNHPNGKAFPSDEDIAFTSKILFSCIINNIEVIDHIVVNENSQFSFEASKTLRELKEDVLRKFPCDELTIEKFGSKSSNYK